MRKEDGGETAEEEEIAAEPGCRQAEGSLGGKGNRGTVVTVHRRLRGFGGPVQALGAQNSKARPQPRVEELRCSEEAGRTGAVVRADQ